MCGGTHLKPATQQVASVLRGGRALKRQDALTSARSVAAVASVLRGGRALKQKLPSPQIYLIFNRSVRPSGRTSIETWGVVLLQCLLNVASVLRGGRALKLCLHVEDVRCVHVASVLRGGRALKQKESECLGRVLTCSVRPSGRTSIETAKVVRDTAHIKDVASVLRGGRALKPHDRLTTGHIDWSSVRPSGRTSIETCFGGFCCFLF